MEFFFDLERDERRCSFCESWQPCSRSYGQCMYWLEKMAEAGLGSEDVSTPTTYEDALCDLFSPDYDAIKDDRDADYTRPGAI